MEGLSDLAFLTLRFGSKSVCLGTSMVVCDRPRENHRGWAHWELLLRRRSEKLLLSARQWQEEMESRFGLLFEILNWDYVERVRQERGFGVSPWATYPRLLVSNKLLIERISCSTAFKKVLKTFALSPSTIPQATSVSKTTIKTLNRIC
jgi:hypothetical protein